MVAFLLMALVAAPVPLPSSLPCFLQPRCLLCDVLMDVVWVPFLEEFDWAISWWCYFFDYYELLWLL